MPKATYKVKNEDAIMNQLFVTTTDKRGPVLIDLWSRDHPDAAWMMSRKEDTYMASGQQFLLPLETGQNPNGGAIGPREGVSLEDYDPLDMARYWPKYYAWNVMRDWEQMAANKGTEAKINLMAAKIDNTVNTALLVFAQHLWTGSGGTSKEMDGLQRLIPATAKASQTTEIGGITPSATNDWWRTHFISMTGKSAAGKLEENMLVLWTDIQDDGGTVNIIFTDKRTHNTYEINKENLLVIDSKVTIGDATFELIKYKGIGMIHSVNAPIGEMRFIEDKAVKFCVDPAYWMKWTPWKQPIDLPVGDVKQFYSRCQMARMNAWHLGCIGNIAAT